jgi:predicted Zn-dependent peptidase
MQVANTILGNGMSSRLFQEIREKRGLVYTVSSFYYSFADNGIFGIYAGANVEKLQELNNAIQQELNKATEDITEEEIEKCKNQFISGLAISAESTSYRAKNNASSLQKYGRIISGEEIVKSISEISKEEAMLFLKNTIQKPNITTIYCNKDIPEIK